MSDATNQNIHHIPDKTTEHYENTTHRVIQGDARERLLELPDESVQLIVTSPPYGNIKNYTDNEKEIGFGQSYLEYHESLIEVFRECIRVLSPGCRMVINIGDQFVSTTSEKPYHILPHSSRLVSNLLGEFRDELIYTGTIHWQKVSTSNTSGGGKIMGSVYHPRNGHFFVNYEHILVFKKLGQDPRPKKEEKAKSKFTLDQRREWFSDTWHIPPVQQDEHDAMFPLEIPSRLIQMYSFVGETVLDPFVGSGTTMKAAAKFDRNSIGIDLGWEDRSIDWRKVIKTKINECEQPFNLQFE